MNRTFESGSHAWLDHCHYGTNDLLKVRMLLAEFNQLQGSGPSESLHTRTSGPVDVQRWFVAVYLCMYSYKYTHARYVYVYVLAFMCYCIPRCRNNFGVFILAKHLYTTQLASLNQLPYRSLKQAVRPKANIQLIVQCFGPKSWEKYCDACFLGTKNWFSIWNSSLLVGPFSKNTRNHIYKNNVSSAYRSWMHGVYQSSSFISAFAS